MNVKKEFIIFNPFFTNCIEKHLAFNRKNKEICGNSLSLEVEVDLYFVKKECLITQIWSFLIKRPYGIQMTAFKVNIYFLNFELSKYC